MGNSESSSSQVQGESGCGTLRVQGERGCGTLKVQGESGCGTGGGRGDVAAGGGEQGRDGGGISRGWGRGGIAGSSQASSPSAGQGHHPSVETCGDHPAAGAPIPPFSTNPIYSAACAVESDQERPTPQMLTQDSSRGGGGAFESLSPVLPSSPSSSSHPGSSRLPTSFAPEILSSLSSPVRVSVGASDSPRSQGPPDVPSQGSPVVHVARRQGARGDPETRILLARPPTYQVDVKALTYQPGSKKDAPLILDDVSMTAVPGEVVAVVGPSGSGKSTLLDALGGRIDPARLAGSVLINGRPMAPPRFRSIAAYVLQDDRLYSVLTVRETLQFSARLRLPQGMPGAEKRARVADLLSQLGLQGCADTRIGDENVRGVSGGERRRTSIGVELIHDPTVLLLDEPTSGLDSTSALTVVEVLHALAVHRQRTVILSVHQPSFRMQRLMHSFVLMARGRCVFSGSAADMEGHFTRLGFTMPQHVDALEFVLDTVEHCSGDPKALSHLVMAQEERRKEEESCTAHATAGMCQDRPDDSGPPGAYLSAPGAGPMPEPGVMAEPPRYATSAFQELRTLCDRCSRILWRSPDLILSRVAVMVAMGLIMGSLFLNAGYTIQGLNHRFAVIGFTVALLFYNSMDALPIFFKERAIFARETSRSAYRCASFVLSSLLVSAPIFAALSLTLSSSLYWLVHLAPTAAAFLLFTSLCCLTLLLANSYVLLWSALAPSYLVAQAAVAATISFFLLFSGFFFSKDAMPGYWVWMYYISLLRFPLELFLWNEFSFGLGPTCFSTFDSVNAIGFTVEDPDSPCGLTGTEYLNAKGVAYSSPLTNLGIILSCIVVFRFGLYFALAKRSSTMRS